MVQQPGQLSLRQAAQFAAPAIQRLVRDPGDRLPDEVVGEVLGELNAAVAAAAGLEALDPQASLADDRDSALADVIQATAYEYLLARQEWGMPSGRAGVWAVEQVVDRFATLGMVAVAREEGDSITAWLAMQQLKERTPAARAAWAAATAPWLRRDVGSLLAEDPPLHMIPTERARSTTTAELHGWIDEALHAHRPSQQEVDAAQTAVNRLGGRRALEGLHLQGLQKLLGMTGSWWWPGTWVRRSKLRAQIADQQQVVEDFSDQLHQAEKQAKELRSARKPNLEAWQAYHRPVVGRAVAAVQELQLREQGWLEDLVADPPEHLLQTFGAPPSDPDGGRAWRAQALELERARAADPEVTDCDVHVAPAEIRKGDLLINEWGARDGVAVTDDPRFDWDLRVWVVAMAKPPGMSHFGPQAQVLIRRVDDQLDTGVEPDFDPADELAAEGQVLLPGYGYAIPREEYDLLRRDYEREVGWNTRGDEPSGGPDLEIDPP